MGTLSGSSADVPHRLHEPALSVTFLPVVGRELRVASRRAATFRVRLAGAIAAAVLGWVFLLGMALSGRGSGAGGSHLFYLLIWLDFALALLSGALLTADCLSREKREGTLGLLFLTDLNGFDVVAGKFTALALVPLHALLATLPVVSMCVFMGGVTAGEFWRCLLVLVNTLLLSLALGIWVSSMVTHGHQATSATLGALAGLTFLPELVAQLTGYLPVPPAWEWVRLISPFGTLLHAFADEYVRGPRGFWRALVWQHGLAWFFLLGAAFVVRRAWREGASPWGGGESSDPVRARPGRGIPRRQRMRLAAEGSLAWYGWRNSWMRREVWWVAGAAVAVALGTFIIIAASGSPSAAGLKSTVAIIFGFYALKLLLAVHAIYFLQHCCRSGAMELLLVTPVTSRRLCDGHFSAMRSVILWPVIILGVVEIGLGIAGKVVAGGDWPSRATMLLWGAGPAAMDVGVHALDLVAVAYHASRWALAYDRPAKALARTTLLVIVLPALFCNYGRIFVDLFVIGHARPMLEHFRELARAWYFPGPVASVFGSPRTG
jgi:hypothetical protein